jgi:Holliday junction resolvase
MRTGRSSDRKGSRGEREFAGLVRAHGFNARRGGKSNLADIIHDVPGIHFEVKWVENLSVHKGFEQALRDAGEDLVPVLAFKKNQHPWMICMMAGDFLSLLADFAKELSNEQEEGRLPGTGTPGDGSL